MFEKITKIDEKTFIKTKIHYCIKNNKVVLGLSAENYIEAKKEWQQHIIDATKVIADLSIKIDKFIEKLSKTKNKVAKEDIKYEIEYLNKELAETKDDYKFLTSKKTKITMEMFQQKTIIMIEKGN